MSGVGTLREALGTQSFEFGGNDRTVFGCGVVEQVGKLARPLAPRALLVTDPGIRAAGLADRVVDALADAHVEVEVFSGVRPNPSTEDIEVGSAQVRAAEAGTIVALGGGSVLDAAKAIALHATNGGDVIGLASNRPKASALPLVAVPTTAGTGAETNAFGVITDPLAGRKFYVGHPSALPRVSLLDPELTVGLPPAGTAAVGIDALTHALESLMSRRANPYAQCLTLEAIQNIVAHLERAVTEGADMEARSHMLLASHLAGLAMRTTGLGIAHAIAHPLGARLDAVHGVALASVLPAVLAFNLPVSRPVLAGAARMVAPMLGLERSDIDDGTAIAAFIDTVRELVVSTLGPLSPSDLGCHGDVVATVVDDALADPVLANTPRMPERHELVALLTSSSGSGALGE